MVGPDAQRELSSCCNPLAKLANASRKRGGGIPADNERACVQIAISAQRLAGAGCVQVNCSEAERRARDDGGVLIGHASLAECLRVRAAHKS